MLLLKALVFFIILNLLLIVHGYNKCVTFDRTDVTVHIKNETEPVNITISGCIERVQEAFNGTDITELYARHQHIPILKEDTIRNMVRLTVASFFGCGIEDILPGAFRNVPRLTQFAAIFSNLSEIHRGVFSGLAFERIRIHNNKIKTIDKEAFGNLSSLKRLYASNNLLETFDPEWFINSTRLELLDLQFNSLVTLPRKCFKKLPKLKELYLDFNEVATIEDEAFSGIKSLKYLGLRYNKLKTISANVFATGLTIHSLLIDANRLNYLPNEVLAKIAVRVLTISGNPWKCPCLERINYWMFEKNGSVKVSRSCEGSDIPICIYPESFSGTCIETVDEEVTKTFLKQVYPMKPKLDKYCIRFD